MKNKKSCIFIILNSLLFIQINCFAQELRLIPDSLERADELSNYVSVRDVNNELCNLVIVRTKLDSLKFHTNRGIERIKKNDAEYRVWIPAGSTLFKVMVPGLPLYEKELTKMNEGFNVYIFNLEVDRSKKIIITDSLKTYLSISSIPTKVLLHINGFFQGRTPVQLPINTDKESVLEFRFTKFGYITREFRDTINPESNIIETELTKLTFLRNHFVALQFGLHDYGNAQPTFGLAYGRTGRTGYFINLKLEYSNNPEEKWGHTNKLSRYKISASVIRSLFTPLYGFAGVGISGKSYGEMLSSEVYEEDGTYFNTNIGIIPRLSRKAMLILELSTAYSIDDGLIIKNKEYSFGFAYAF